MVDTARVVYFGIREISLALVTAAQSAQADEDPEISAGRLRQSLEIRKGHVSWMQDRHPALVRVLTFDGATLTEAS